MPQMNDEITNNCFDCGDGEPGIDDAGSRCANCELHYQDCDICETHVDTRNVHVGECEACFKVACEDCSVRVDYFDIDNKQIWCERCAEEPVLESNCTVCDEHYDPKCTIPEYHSGDYNAFCSEKCKHDDENEGCEYFVEPDDEDKAAWTPERIKELCITCQDQVWYWQGNHIGNPTEFEKIVQQQVKKDADATGWPEECNCDMC